jgi:hypothetical protein
MSGEIKENVTRRSIWLRLVFMIIMSAAYSVAEIVILTVVVFQFLASLITGQPNDQLARFGRNLARYLQQNIVFMTFTTEEKPFPFTPWPDEPHEETPVAEDSKQQDDKSENTGDEAKKDKADEAINEGDTEVTENAEDPDKPKD